MTSVSRVDLFFRRCKEHAPGARDYMLLTTHCVCVCMCIISHPAVPCLSLPLSILVHVWLLGGGGVAPRVLVHTTYISLASSRVPIRYRPRSQSDVYTRTKVSFYPSVCPESRRFFLFFPTRCVLRHRPVFFFFLQLIASPVFCFIAFFGGFVCLFIIWYKIKKKSKVFEILGAARGDMLRL